MRVLPYSIIILDSRNNSNKGNIPVIDNPCLDLGIPVPVVFRCDLPYNDFRHKRHKRRAAYTDIWCNGVQEREKEEVNHVFTGKNTGTGQGRAVSEGRDRDVRIDGPDVS